MACPLNNLRFSADARKTVNGTGTNRPTVKREAHNKPISDVVQSDNGRYRLGLHDDTGPGFETRTFAAAVLALERPPPDDPKTRRPAAANDGPDRDNHQKRKPSDFTLNRTDLQGVSALGGAA